MTRRAYTLALTIAVLMTALACTRGEEPAQTSAAPDFTLQDLAGKNVRLSDLKGKVVLVEFWATWCPPCRESVPAIERLHKAYVQKGLVVLGVSLDEGWESVGSFARQYGITYPVLKGTDEVTAKYRVRVIPSMFLVDKEGIIAKQYLGGENEDGIERDIRALL